MGWRNADSGHEHWRYGEGEKRRKDSSPSQKVTVTLEDEYGNWIDSITYKDKEAAIADGCEYKYGRWIKMADYDEYIE